MDLCDIHNILEDFETHHHNFSVSSQTVNAIEKLLAALNVQLKLGMNQSSILLYHNEALLVTSHGST